jgi:hypothetical protein
MTDRVTEWMSSFAAIQMLRGAGVVDPVSTLTQLAEARQVRARATWGRFDGVDNDQVFPQEPKLDPKTLEAFGPWPDIPADFWRWVNAGSQGNEIHGEAGVFAATVVYDPELGEASDKEHIKLFGVTFRAADITAILAGVPGSFESPPLMTPSRSTAGRKPELDRWAEFGAALALVANLDGTAVRASQSALYSEVANALTEAAWQPLDEKVVRKMVRHAFHWIEAGEIPKKVKEA